MTQEQQGSLTDFLKTYAELSNDIESLKEGLPLKFRVSMSGRACWVEDKSGLRIADFYIETGSASMPVHPLAMAMCKFFIETVHHALQWKPPAMGNAA